MAYNVVTLTGIADGAAWERLARRAQRGDLAPWMRELDNLRHEVTGKILLPVEWSPLQEVDLTTVPTDGAMHPLEFVHGGHRMALRPAGRLHPLVG